MSMPKTKRGGGPKTAEGKASAAANSLKSGTYASVIVLPGESEQDFQALQDQFVNDFLPEDVVERALVHELAAIVWKKLRLEKLEKAAFIRALNTPLTDFDFLEVMNIPSSYNHYLANIELFTEDFIAKFEDYAEYISNISVNPGKDDFLRLCKEKPSLFAEIVGLAKGQYKFKEPNPELTPELLLTLDIQTETSKISFINYALKEIKGIADDVAWIAKRLDRIRDTIAHHKETRLLNLMQSQGLMRARDELSRTFYRTLSEFRKQQSWRLKMRLETSTEVKEEKT